MNHAYFNDSDCDVSALKSLCSQEVVSSDYPSAADIVNGIVVFDGQQIQKQAATDEGTRLFHRELARCLKDGPGVAVFRNAYRELDVIDQTTKIFRKIVETEKQLGTDHRDHFGSNERIWNSMQKACIADPTLFIAYYQNPLIHLASHAWLGPNYQVTAQMNNVRPGGKAQQVHRDYHLGFQDETAVAAYPIHVHEMSQYLTLQGAIAHCDTPADKGATMLLPFSQQFAAGYLCHRRAEFKEFFERKHVQPELRKGDAIFFNPAVFHAGGANRTQHDRIANLLQISSAFGKTMESLDHNTMIDVVYPKLLDMKDKTARHRIIQTVANGYAFPTNLDSDPPQAGCAPRSQAMLVENAVEEEWSLTELQVYLKNHERQQEA